MNKKILIFLIILIIILLAGGIYVFMQKMEERSIGYENYDSFKKTEQNNITYMENKAVGLKFAVPSGWNVSASQLASVSLTTPDFAPFADKPSAASVPKTGCWIGVTVKTEKENSSYDIYYSNIKNSILTQDFYDTEKVKHKIIELGKYKALWTQYLVDGNEDNKGEAITVETVNDNRIYTIAIDLFGQDQDKCLNEFNNFLKTVTIK